MNKLSICQRIHQYVDKHRPKGLISASRAYILYIMQILDQTFSLNIKQEMKVANLSFFNILFIINLNDKLKMTN